MIKSYRFRTINMKTINNLMLKDIADKLFLELSEDQYHLLLEEISIIEKEMSILDEIPEMKDITPMSFPFEMTSTYLREDEPQEALNSNDTVKNAGKSKDGYIVLPKVI